MDLTKKEIKTLAQKIYSFCEKYYKDSDNLKFPTIKNIIEYTGKSKKIVIEILDLLVDHNYLKKIRNKYYFPKQKIKRQIRKKNKPEPINNQFPVTIEQSNIEKPAVQNEPIKNENHDPVIDDSIWNKIKKIDFDKIIIYKVLIFISFVGIVYQAFKYNYIGYSQFKDKNDAIISAISFTIEAIILFEAAIIFYIKKSKLKYLFFGLFLIVFFNNFINVMSGQYSTYQDKIFDIKNIESNNNLSLNQLNEKKEREYEEELVILNKDRIRLKQNIIDNSNDKISKNELWVIENRKLPSIKKELENTRANIKEMLGKKDFNQIKQMNFYEFISSIWIFKIFNVKANFLQFIHYVFYTLLLDLLSSISLTLIFFLKKDNKKLENL